MGCRFLWLKLEIGYKVHMCITFIVHMDMGKVRSDNSSLLVLGLPCSLEQLLDL